MARERFGLDLEQVRDTVFGARASTIDLTACEITLIGDEDAKADVEDGVRTLRASEIAGFSWQPGVPAKLAWMFFLVEP